MLVNDVETNSNFYNLKMIDILFIIRIKIMILLLISLCSKSINFKKY